MTTLAADLGAVFDALTMLAQTPGGDAYAFGEDQAMLRATGFPDAALHDLVPSPNRALVATRS